MAILKGCCVNCGHKLAIGPDAQQAIYLADVCDGQIRNLGHFADEGHFRDAQREFPDLVLEERRLAGSKQVCLDCSTIFTRYQLTCSALGGASSWRCLLGWSRA